MKKEFKFLHLPKYFSLHACTPCSVALCNIDMYGFCWHVNRKSNEVLCMLALSEVEEVQAMVERSYKSE